MPRRDLEDHRALALRIINARLAAEVRMRHLRVLQTHEAEIFAKSGMKRGLSKQHGDQVSYADTRLMRDGAVFVPLLGEAGCCIRALGIRLGIC